MLEKLKQKLQKQALVVLVFVLGAIASKIFAPFNGIALGYVAFISFLMILFYEKRSFFANFKLGYVFGVTFFVCCFSWIANALLVDGEKFATFVPLVLWAIGAFFGLFVGIPAGFTCFAKNIYQRAISFCLMFSIFEWVRSFIFTGFPWNLLGSALAFDIRLISGAAYIGTYGLSLMLLLLMSAVAIFLMGVWQKKLYKISLVFMFVSVIFFGWSGSKFQSVPSGDFVVRLVQPSIPQTFKWDEDLALKNFNKHLSLTAKEGIEKVKLIVWGETASPYMLDRDEFSLRELMSVIPNDALLVTGVLRAGIENGDLAIYNSMFAIDNVRGIRDYYDKVHLVPFGEYLPFREYLPDFMSPVANIVGDMYSGEKYKLIKVDGFPNMGGAICYESIFPKEVIDYKNKPEILLVLANDGWYGVSAGPYQHLVASQLRAVEEGVSVVRSANTGVSAVINPNGEIAGRIELNENGFIDVNLPKDLTIDTLYGKYGNLIVFLLWFVFALVFLSLEKDKK